MNPKMLLLTPFLIIKNRHNVSINADYFRTNSNTQIVKVLKEILS